MSENFLTWQAFKDHIDEMIKLGDHDPKRIQIDDLDLHPTEGAYEMTVAISDDGLLLRVWGGDYAY